MTNEELVYLYRQGNKQALEKLLEENKGIVNKIVNKFYTERTSSIDREDLMQEGYIGLMTAANKYDFDNEKKAQFTTYAVNWIYQKINNFIRKRNTNDEISLNTPNGEDGSTELMDCIEGVDYSYENIEEQLYIGQLHRELDEVMNEHNTLREKQIIKLHYGWDKNKCMTFRELGELFDVSGTMIQNIEKEAFRKIRKTPWGVNKAKELYAQKQLQSSYNNAPGVIEKISFASRYLSEVM